MKDQNYTIVKGGAYVLPVFIDNPDPEAQDPKLIGELSDVLNIYPHYMTDNETNLIYYARWIISHEKRTKIW